MQVIAVIDDARVVERILRHLGVWHDPPGRPPPPGCAFCRYHQPDDKGGPRHNIKRINEPLSPALSPLVPRGERESLRARFGGTDEMRTPPGVSSIGY